MLCRLSLTNMAAMVRKREVSPLELVEAHLRQIEERNPAINAFTMVLGESAREEARRVDIDAPGLLRGVPVTVKDSFDLAGAAFAGGKPRAFGPSRGTRCGGGGVAAAARGHHIGQDQYSRDAAEL